MTRLEIGGLFDIAQAMQGRKDEDPDHAEGANLNGDEHHLVEHNEITRDALAADDAHCRGESIHYRNDDPAGPGRVHGTGEYTGGKRQHPGTDGAER